MSTTQWGKDPDIAGNKGGNIPPAKTPPQHGAPPPPQPVQYTGGHQPGGSYILSSGQPPAPPPVPKKGGKAGTIAADVPGLNAFTNSIVDLNGALDTANVLLLRQEPVQPGAFYEGQQVRNAVNGGNGGGKPLIPTYLNVLNDLQKGVLAILDAGVQMAQTYKSADDLNNMTANDVQNDMNSASSYFAQSMTDNGGSSGNNNGGSK